MERNIFSNLGWFGLKLLQCVPEMKEGKMVFLPLLLYFKLVLDAEMNPSRKNKMHI